MKKSEFLRGCIKPMSFRPILLEDKRISFIEVNLKRNIVRCINRTNNDSEPFTVRTNTPLHQGQCAGYFQVKVTNISNEKSMAVGLCRKDCSMKRQPGSSKWSIGLEANGVVSYEKQRLGTAFKFGKDDTVGCGVVYDTLEVFFTKNGNHEPKIMFKLQDAFGEFYPNASLHSEAEELEFNFGEKPFRFDFGSFLEKLRDQRIQSILDSKAIEIGSIYKLVQEYLYFSGYSDTLKMFKETTGSNEPGNYLLPDPTGKDLLGLDKQQDGQIELIIEEEHKAQVEDNNDIVGEMDESKRQTARRERIMSESCHFFNLPVLPFRKESYDEQLIKFMGRKDSVLSVDEGSIRMETEDVQASSEKQLQEQLVGPQTRHFLQNQRLGTTKVNIDILNAIKEMRIQDAMRIISREIPRLWECSPCLQYYMHGHIYLRLIKEKRIYDAIDYARENKLNSHKEELFPRYCPDRLQLTKIKFDELISAVISSKDFSKSLLSRQQFYAFSELVNNEIMRCLGFQDKSKLELMVAHVRCIEDRYEKERLNGDRIQLFN